MATAVCWTGVIGNAAPHANPVRFTRAITSRNVTGPMIGAIARTFRNKAVKRLEWVVTTAHTRGFVASSMLATIIGALEVGNIA